MPFYALIRNRERRNCVVRRNARAGRNRLIHRGTMQRGLDIRIRAEMDPPFLHPPLRISPPCLLPSFPALVLRSQMSQSANLTQMLENRALQSLHPSPLSSLTPDSLITLVFLPSNDSERLSLKQDSKDRISLPQDRSGVLKVTFRHGVVGPARRAGFIRQFTLLPRLADLVTSCR